MFNLIIDPSIGRMIDSLSAGTANRGLGKEEELINEGMFRGCGSTMTLAASISDWREDVLPQEIEKL